MAMRWLARAGLAAALLLAAHAIAAADEVRPPPARISQEAAMLTAVKLIPGRANSVDVERKRGRWTYVVEIITPNGDEQDVFVDIETGEIIGTD
jgi:uncharacterized membrane protein YkoI